MTAPASAVVASSTQAAKAAVLITKLSPHEWGRRRLRLDVWLGLCAIVTGIAAGYPIVMGKESAMLENLGLTALMTGAALIANYVWGAKADDVARTATLADMLKARARGGTP